MRIEKDGYFFRKSNRKNKKYDVYDKNGSYIISFGDKRYQHYKDKIGLYSHLDHNDKKRRDRYRSRHRNDMIDNDNFAGFFSWNYLW